MSSKPSGGGLRFRLVRIGGMVVFASGIIFYSFLFVFFLREWVEVGNCVG